MALSLGIRIKIERGRRATFLMAHHVGIMAYAHACASRAASCRRRRRREGPGREREEGARVAWRGDDFPVIGPGRRCHHCHASMCVDRAGPRGVALPIKSRRLVAKIAPRATSACAFW
jgi:hypothetical protein